MSESTPTVILQRVCQERRIQALKVAAPHREELDNLGVELSASDDYYTRLAGAACAYVAAEIHLAQAEGLLE